MAKWRWSSDEGFQRTRLTEKNPNFHRDGYLHLARNRQIISPRQAGIKARKEMSGVLVEKGDAASEILVMRGKGLRRNMGRSKSSAALLEPGTNIDRNVVLESTVEYGSDNLDALHYRHRKKQPEI